LGFTNSMMAETRKRAMERSGVEMSNHVPGGTG
jgi:hypothetical protein